MFEMVDMYLKYALAIFAIIAVAACGYSRLIHFQADTVRDYEEASELVTVFVICGSIAVILLVILLVLHKLQS